MTRKQATIAVRSGLNDDEQYGCVVPLFISPVLIILRISMSRARTIIRAGVTQPAMLYNVH